MVLSKEPAAGREFSLLARAIFADIQDYFGEGIGDPIMTQFNLAKWHMEKKRYLNAVSTACETCITFAMALRGDAGDTHDSRDKYGKLLVYLYERYNGPLDEVSRQFMACYDKVRRVRNMLAHPTQNFNRDERTSLVEILVCDELQSRELKQAKNALSNIFGIRAGRLQEECIQDLEERNAPTWARRQRGEARLLTLATQLPDPFKAVLMALQIVIERMLACYQANYFTFKGNAHAAANREERKGALDRGWMERFAE